MIKRLIDLTISILGLLFFFPLFIIIAILIKLESKGDIFYKQERIGLFEKPFYLIKFRSMFINSDSKGLLTVGMNDNRITKVGFFIRKYKIDELSQLFNVLIGDMSLVGPRPEVKKYVEGYSSYEKKIFKVRPGITDIASVFYFNENEILSQSKSPEDYYVENILPHKLKLGILYINNISIILDLKIIVITLLAIFNRKKSLFLMNKTLSTIK